MKNSSPVITIADLQRRVMANKTAPAENAYFNPQAYELAKETMSDFEAWKLAHNINAVAAFFVARARLKEPKKKA